MFTINQRECKTKGCNVVSFNYASCEPPICPVCHVCADCGINAEEEYHGEYCEPDCADCKFYKDDDFDRDFCEKCQENEKDMFEEN